jgi:hypothetical protein
MGTEAVTETPKWHLIVPQDIAAMSQERAVVAGGLLPMEASAQYREFAQECDRLVEETKDPRHKQVLLEMAQAWRNLADEEDGKKTP